MHAVNNSTAGGPGARGNPGSPHLPSIVNADGVRWIEFRRTLQPNYSMVWRDIAMCYVALALGAVGVALLAPDVHGWLLGVIVVVAGVWIGYWLHSLFLFGHEAAHANLAPRRAVNDRLGDAFVWVFFGSTTVNYRFTHMTHHSHLGDHQDTEVSYHLCLSVLNMLKAVTGLRVFEVLIFKVRNRGTKRSARKSSRTSGGVLASLRSVILHGLVLAALYVTGGPFAAMTWVVGVGAVFPLCATMRTIVEHRKLDAACSVDFTVEVHGAYNRLFGTGFISRTFGSAGFNRHLLHHWDPAISYTRFEEMEQYFLNTQLARVMEANRTTYVTALTTLMKEARHG
jgi:fatty acid desaturase